VIVPVELHGPDAASHDHHAATEGAFAAALATLADARAAGDTTVVTTAVTRSSYRALSSMPALLQRHGVAAWNLRVIRFAEVPAADASRRVPRLALALPFALHALASAARHGVAAYITDAPRCLLGPYARDALRTATASFPSPCTTCAARDRCAGVDPAYVDRFGAGELHPLADAGPPLADAGRFALP
jgi:hypothetical protein